MNQIFFTGYDAVHQSDFVFDNPDGYDCYLFLLTRTPAEFWCDGKLVAYPAGSAILYPPKHKIYYRACDTTYSNDWIRFASDEAYATNFPLKGVPFPVTDPEYCHNLVQLITWESSFQSEHSQMIISNLLKTLFLKIFDDSTLQEHSSLGHELLNLRKDIMNRPWLPWTVQSMADQLHISAGYLHSLYKQKFGVSCMDDVIEGRIRNAKDILVYTDMSIAEIATDCGYNNTEHFNRQFRKRTGMTPSEFRDQATKQHCEIKNTSLYRNVSHLNY